MEMSESRSFWQSVSLKELAEEQGSRGGVRYYSIAALWPAEDDPDSLLKFIIHERRERRRAAASVA